MLACCVIYIVTLLHTYSHGTMVFAKALLSLGRCLMATQHALYTTMLSVYVFLLDPFDVGLEFWHEV